MNDILIFIYSNPLAQTIRENELLFPWIEAIHVLAVTLVIGSIALVDLRLIGVRALNRAISNISKELLPITWMAFLAAAITGAILFTSNALSYSQNFYFISKIILLGLAGINMMCFQFIIGKNLDSWNHYQQLPIAARSAGAISLTLWISIIFCGRWIGFTLELVSATS
ncbi:MULTISPECIES: DUF6644 family protein [unclassified Polynucleobacter]|jgi:hypothetical protein|uniref:DUF6644 family protein n=1 Tax=unclassified Polynucleobacter TaxID=2640945 RepID=UPI001BFDE0F3|nr:MULTISPECIES: DUF6644 family protein [unclassified Polynucleobacter]MEA9604286.1 DUF6644 family protein [Polynucleobacter sp. JS-JIR-II-c23]QWE03171.1 hypothetical protein ICV90_03530 [Polynucleobacter sp. JS-JIR-II-b4]